jgi:hypothetical protein
MSEYREECLRRKAVQAGFVEDRPIGGRKKKKAEGEWLLVTCLFTDKGGWYVYSDHKTEEEARSVQRKGWFRLWLVNRQVFEQHYKHMKEVTMRR